MNEGLISSFPRCLVFTESGKIDSNKQGSEMNRKELKYRGKKDDELRKVFKSKDYNLSIDDRTVVTDLYGTGQLQISVRNFYCYGL